MTQQTEVGRIDVLRALFRAVTPRRRKQMFALTGLMIAGALAELLSLGAIVPFLAILADAEQAMQRRSVAWVVDAFGLRGAEDLRLQLTLFFAAAAVVAGLVRFALIYGTARINFAIAHELCAEIFRRSLHQPYEVHVSRNTSEVTGSLTKVDNAAWVLFAVLNSCSAALMAVFIVIALVLIDPAIASIALLSFAAIYLTVSAFTRRRLARNSRVIGSAISRRLQTMEEGLGSIRDVLLDRAQEIFSTRFGQADWPMRRAQMSNNIIGPSPRFAVEALGMVMIAVLGYYMTSSRGAIQTAIPTLGALALGAQRLMPLLQQIYQGWVQLTGERQVLADVVSLLEQPMGEEGLPPSAPLQFTSEIRMNDVSFRYKPELPLVLEDINLVIPKGAKVGIIGTTGSGKSTATDLLMGLLQPTSGAVIVDGSPLLGAARLAWRQNVAHVPQALYLADASFAENIAFGVVPTEIDMERVRSAAARAQIAGFIDSNPQGYLATVGERGVRLSGGQRQRIGIARALYKQAQVLILDEATSALDGDTEREVLNAIDAIGHGVTIIVIAHRLTTLRGCDMVYRLDHGCVVDSGTYEGELATQSQSRAAE